MFLAAAIGWIKKTCRRIKSGPHVADLTTTNNLHCIATQRRGQVVSQTGQSGACEPYEARIITALSVRGKECDRFPMASQLHFRVKALKARSVQARKL
jgi:hypothetical protein